MRLGGVAWGEVVDTTEMTDKWDQRCTGQGREDTAKRIKPKRGPEKTKLRRS
jgi:hypothetical protein